VINSDGNWLIVDVKAAVVKNAVLTQKLGISKEPKLIFYRYGVPILFDCKYYRLFLFIIYFVFVGKMYTNVCMCLSSV